MNQSTSNRVEALSKIHTLKTLAARYLTECEALAKTKREALEIFGAMGIHEARNPEAIQALKVLGFELEQNELESPKILAAIENEKHNLEAEVLEIVGYLETNGDRYENEFIRESVLERNNQEVEKRYRTLIEQLAQNYGVANDSLQHQYMKAAYQINSIWLYDPDGVLGSSVARKRVCIRQIEDIICDIENKRLSNESHLFFRWDTNRETQIEKQREFYSEFTDQLDFSIKAHEINIKVRLKPNVKTNSKGTPIGTQPLSIPHVDIDKLHLLDGFYLIYGNVQCIYRFDSGKEIKVNVQSQKEGLRVINRLLKIVRPEVTKGTAAKHCIFSEHKKGIELAGERANCIGYWIYCPDSSHSEHSFSKATALL